MKKILNVILICSIFTLSTTPTFAKGWFKKDKTEKETKEKVEIVKPEKEKTNLKHEIKKIKYNAKSQQESSKEAEGMYETKFPAINRILSNERRSHLKRLYKTRNYSPSNDYVGH